MIYLDDMCLPYKKSLKWFTIIFFLLGKPLTTLSQYGNIGLVTVSKHDILWHPEKMLTAYYPSIPLSMYSPQMIKIQESINNNHAESIVCSAHADSSLWTKIDLDIITPADWQWIDLKGYKEDGSICEISLRRPIWWIKEHQIEGVGDRIFIDMPEMGLSLWATVSSIRANQLDMRFWGTDEDSSNNTTMPITGKFKHVSNQVYELFFSKQAETLRVTGDHLIWSTTRNRWVPARELNPSEKVKTTEGSMEVNKTKKVTGTYEVYNLEVYRNHNYHVTRNSILVHNECWNPHWQKIANQIGDNLYRTAIQDAEHIQRIRIIYQPSKNWKGTYGNDWSDLFNHYGKKDYPTVVQINVDVSGLSQSQIDDLADIARGRGFIPYTNPAVDLQKANVGGEERVFMPIRRYGNDALPGHGEGAPVVPQPETLWNPGRKF